MFDLSDIRSLQRKPDLDFTLQTPIRLKERVENLKHNLISETRSNQITLVLSIKTPLYRIFLERMSTRVKLNVSN